MCVVAATSRRETAMKPLREVGLGLAPRALPHGYPHDTTICSRWPKGRSPKASDETTSQPRKRNGRTSHPRHAPVRRGPDQPRIQKRSGGARPVGHPTPARSMHLEEPRTESKPARRHEACARDAAKQGDRRGARRPRGPTPHSARAISLWVSTPTHRCCPAVSTRSSCPLLGNRRMVLLACGRA